jgi:hypothetical protein
MVRCAETYGEGSGAYGVSVEKPEGKGPLESHRRRWDNIIKMDFQEII